MKKKLLFVAVAVMAIGMTACSKKQDTPETTTAVETTTEAETTEAETEDIDEDSINGEITKTDGDILTVKNIDDDTEKNYDTSKAEITKDFPFAVGDQVEVIFPEGSEEDPVPALAVTVTESATEADTDSDPTVEGKVVDAANATLTLEVDGEQYSMNKANAYVVAKDGITVDKNAKVTYLGDLDDEPMAVKIVMEDSYDTPEAELNVFTGKVAQIGEDGKSIVLEADGGDFFTFVSDSLSFDDYKDGDTVKVTYQGSIGAKEIPALEIEK